MISFDHVSKHYGDRTAVNDLNLEIKAGEVFGFLGPNGAGKTSTLKMLMGLTPISEGTITVSGMDITQNPLDVRQILGYIPDRPFLYDLLTAGEAPFGNDDFEVFLDPSGTTHGYTEFEMNARNATYDIIWRETFGPDGPERGNSTFYSGCESTRYRLQGRVRL